MTRMRTTITRKPCGLLNRFSSENSHIVAKNGDSITDDFRRNYEKTYFGNGGFGIWICVRADEGRVAKESRRDERGHFQVAKRDAGQERASRVFFARNNSGEHLKLYKATGRELKGKIALKVIFEDRNTQYLDHAMLSDLAKETNGTFIDSVYFSSARGTAQGSLAMAKEHGWDKVAPCEIIDKDGDMDLPVRNGNILKYFRVGKGFEKYDGAIAVMLFKPHYLPQYDGMTKALSIPFGSLSGKAILHSGGESNAPRYPGNGGEKFKLAVADATKAANDAKPWVYINVLADICVDDSCSDAKPFGNIGVLASTDPVAIDRAACDMTFGQGTDAQVAAWEKRHGVDVVLNAAEKIGAGKQKYRIVEVR